MKKLILITISVLSLISLVSCKNNIITVVDETETNLTRVEEELEETKVANKKVLKKVEKEETIDREKLLEDKEKLLEQKEKREKALELVKSQNLNIDVDKYSTEKLDKAIEEIEKLLKE